MLNFFQQRTHAMMPTATHDEWKNEPFWGVMRDTGQTGLAVTGAQRASGYATESAGAVADREFLAGEFAPGGGWEVLVARKAAAA